MRSSRTSGFAAIGVVYVAGAAIGLGCYHLLPGLSWPVALLVADIAATVFVYLTSLALRNASVYDPYWSVAPPVICTGFAIAWHNWDAGVVLSLVVIWLWGVRLTVNWALTFRDLDHQDWRYDDLKRQSGRWFQVVSLVGIMLFPTLVVYACTVPAVVFIHRGGLNPVFAIGCLISLCGIGLELVADTQMRAFRRGCSDRSKIIRNGLWKYARHPNYLGEIMMWWGVYVTAVAVAPNLWWLGVGALINTAMFVFVTIPMADRRNSSLRADFEDYRRQTRSLLPLPKRA